MLRTERSFVHTLDCWAYRPAQATGHSFPPLVTKIKQNHHFLTRPLRLAPPLHPALLGRSNAIAARPADPIGYVLSAAASVLEQPTVSGVA
jgi:hypothetical protein